MTSPWYKKAYNRNVVDMHINDWDDMLLSQFDPDQYVADMLKAGAESTVLYAHSHVGLTNYPTQYGQMHRGLKGRDVYSETAAACRNAGVAVQLYFSLVFDTWAYRSQPDWRIRNADGTGVADTSRYGVCCPNSPYRDHVVRMIDEFCDTLEFDGVRFDMTFWPTVCFCQYCRGRFQEEVGYDLPTIVNWDDLVWVAFARKREQWLNEFAERATRAVHARRPDASVEHQASTMAQFWRFGVTWELSCHNTFLQGDFYGDILQSSVARKVFYNMTGERPAGFETSFSVSLQNHTARKAADWMRCMASAAVADGAAFVFIDAIDPEGTLNPAVYETMAPIFAETSRYKPFLGGERCQDVAVFLSTESKFDPADNGMDLAQGTEGATNQGPSKDMPHIDAMVAASGALIGHHIPFGIITKRNLDQLDAFRVIVLPDVLMMDEEETAALRAYVKQGGILYASKHTSLQRKDGSRPGDFMLGDVFGVSYRGETSEQFTYVAPAAGREALFENYSGKYPLGIAESQVRVSAAEGADVWATTVLPFSHPEQWENFTSIHSNPPGRPTEEPAVIHNRFGRGRTLFVTAPIENYEIFGRIFINLLRELSPSFSIEADAPPVVEVMAFWQQEENRHIVAALNFQQKQPNVPVRGVRLRVQTAGRLVKAVRLLPDLKKLEFETRDDRVEFTSPEVDVLRMFAVEYE